MDQWRLSIFTLMREIQVALSHMLFLLSPADWQKPTVTHHGPQVVLQTCGDGLDPPDISGLPLHLSLLQPRSGMWFSGPQRDPTGPPLWDWGQSASPHQQSQGSALSASAVLYNDLFFLAWNHSSSFNHTDPFLSPPEVVERLVENQLLPRYWLLCVLALSAEKISNTITLRAHSCPQQSWILIKTRYQKNWFINLNQDIYLVDHRPANSLDFHPIMTQRLALWTEQSPALSHLPTQTHSFQLLLVSLQKGFVVVVVVG